MPLPGLECYGLHGRAGQTLSVDRAEEPRIPERSNHEVELRAEESRDSPSLRILKMNPHLRMLVLRAHCLLVDFASIATVGRTSLQLLKNSCALLNLRSTSNHVPSPSRPLFADHHQQPG